MDFLSILSGTAMSATTRLHGTLRDGRVANSITLSNANEAFAVEIMEYGASIRAMRVPDRNGGMFNSVLSYASLHDYETSDAYLGATIGRCAGRTATGPQANMPLTCNEQSNHLHGGKIGFSHSLWHTLEVTDGEFPHARLQHRSCDGEDGYPGNLVVDIEFRLIAPFVLQVTIEGRSDAATPLNMTLHPYFNLNGDPRSSVENHRLRIAASRYLPLDRRRLPTGAVLGVERTPFDFLTARRIGNAVDASDPQLRIPGGYDHYWVLNDDAPIAADVFSPTSGVGLRMHTDQKGLQFYSGNTLHKAGPAAFPARSGFCLEPQDFPNAINEPRFSDITLRAGERYRHRTCYAFYARPPHESTVTPND